jgi:hypothetical protein
MRIFPEVESLLTRAKSSPYLSFHDIANSFSLPHSLAVLHCPSTMAPHVDFTPETAQGRDLESEAQVYVRKVVENTKGAKALCPLDTPEKTDQAMPFWVGFYDVIAFTTLDIELENAVLKHPEILKLMPDIRYVMGECEGALEETWAERVVAAKDSTEGMLGRVKLILHRS